MKVLLTILGPDEAIKVDFPIMPEFDSKIYLSDSDYNKLHHTLKNQPPPLGMKIPKKEMSMAADIMLENSTVQYIDIAWDEEEHAYLPLIGLSLSEDFFDDDNYDDDDDFMDEDTDFEDIDEKPQHKGHTHGKKKNLFN
ncbi:MAG: hypothetical protein J6W06_01150 [Bacteroidales bacterium]|nr:hypothetical protein [Bacteroidales bacterium]